jgi:heme-degrading monooxygenase HmoA
LVSLPFSIIELESSYLASISYPTNAKIPRELNSVMVKIVEMDEGVTIKSQLEEDVGPVIVLNKFTVPPEEVTRFLKVFEDTTKLFKQQPGFISAQLHRGIGGSSTFFNYVVWESAGHFKQAFSRPEFQSSMAEVLPNTTMSPHLFKKVAVPGICVE